MFQPEPETIDTIQNDSIHFLKLDTGLLPCWKFVFNDNQSPFVYHIDSSLVHAKNDSLLKANHIIPGLRKSIFTILEYKPVDRFPQSYFRRDELTILSGIIFLLSFVFFVILFRISGRKLIDYIKASYSLKFFNKMIAEDEPSWFPPMPVTLFVSGAILGNVGIYLYFLNFSQIKIDQLLIFFVVSLFSLPVLIILRSGIFQILGSILKINQFTKVHANFAYLSLVGLSLLFLPIFITLTLYSELIPLDLIAKTISLLLVLYYAYYFLRILWYVRGEGRFYILNFFLYFCTLEILPILFIYKSINSNLF